MSKDSVQRKIVQEVTRSPMPPSEIVKRLAVGETQAETIQHAIQDLVRGGTLEIGSDWQVRLRKEVEEVPASTALRPTERDKI